MLLLPELFKNCLYSLFLFFASICAGSICLLVQAADGWTRATGTACEKLQ